MDDGTSHPEHEATVARTPKRRWALLVWVVLFLPFLVVTGGLLFLVGSEAGSVFLVEQLVQQVSTMAGCSATVAGISGTMASELQLGTLQMSAPRAGMRIQAQGLAIRVHLRSLVQQKLRLERVHCRECRVEGPLTPLLVPRWPQIPATACLAAPDGRLSVDAVSVGLFQWAPLATSSLELEIADLEMGPGSGSSGTMARAQLTGRFQERPFARGRYEGVVATHGRQIDGTLSARLLGGELATQLSVRWTKKDWLVSGELGEAALSLASFSQWLQPFWQDTHPLGFEGLIEASGPWMIRPDLGWCGNLQGRLRGGRVVMLGLLHPLAHLDTSWRLFNDEFQCFEPRLAVLGFPATATLRLDKLFSPSRSWTFMVAVPELDVGRWLADLPWNIRYLLPHHAVTGSIALDARVLGTTPSVRGRVGGVLGIHEPAFGQASLTLDLSYAGDSFRPGVVNGRMSWTAQELPPVLESTSGPDAPLRRAVRSPVSLDLTCSGISTGQLSWQGTLRGADDSLLALSAEMMDGAWAAWRWTDPRSGVRLSTGSGFPSIGQLLLVQP